jgi:hypothetical protein
LPVTEIELLVAKLAADQESKVFEEKAFAYHPPVYGPKGEGQASVEGQGQEKREATVLTIPHDEDKDHEKEKDKEVDLEGREEVEAWRQLTSTGAGGDGDGLVKDASVGHEQAEEGGLPEFMNPTNPAPEPGGEVESSGVRGKRKTPPTEVNGRGEGEEMSFQQGGDAFFQQTEEAAAEA